MKSHPSCILARFDFSRGAYTARSLVWMANKAIECGLAVDTGKTPSLPTTTQPITNSYKEFLGGAYGHLTGNFTPVGKIR